MTVGTNGRHHLTSWSSHSSPTSPMNRVSVLSNPDYSQVTQFSPSSISFVHTLSFSPTSHHLLSSHLFHQLLPLSFSLLCFTFIPTVGLCNPPTHILSHSAVTVFCYSPLPVSAGSLCGLAAGMRSL